MLVETQGLCVSLGGRQVVQNVNLTLERGEIVTIVGPNGSGKSTLLRALTGAIRPDRGVIRRAPGLRIGYSPQRLHIDPTLPLSVRRFMALPARRVDEAQMIAALEATGAAALADHPMQGLSGGQTQRVLLARALLAQPDLIVLDEPAQGLDQPGSASLYRLIEAVRGRTGAAVLMVSHDLHVVMSGSDRVICLNGHICCEGAPDVVSSAPEWRALFGDGSGGALALYQHSHDHRHDHDNAEESCTEH